MLKPKKKLNITNEVKETLEELTLWQQIQQYWDSYRNYILYGGGGAVVVVLGIIYWSHLQEAGTAEASLELSRIQSYYDAGQYTTAISGDTLKMIDGQPIKGLQSIVEHYGGTLSGKIASLYLANCYYYTGDDENAQKCYEKAESLPDPVFSAAGYAGEGAVLESKKRLDEAAKYYERAANMSDANPNNAAYLVYAARCFAGSSQTPKAIELYKRVVFDFAGTNAEETARRALAVLHSEPL